MQIPGWTVDESAEAKSHEDHEDEDTFNSRGRLLNSNTRARTGTVGFSFVGDPGFIGLSINHLDNNYGVHFKPFKNHCRSTLRYAKDCAKQRLKRRVMAGEMLNDWDAIFQVVASYHLPLTNNEAERALRHWVILRRISYGARTEQGSRVFAIFISVIETCRKRQQSPWLYLAVVIDHQRTGRPIPKLPPVDWGV